MKNKNGSLNKNQNSAKTSQKGSSNPAFSLTPRFNAFQRGGAASRRISNCFNPDFAFGILGRYFIKCQLALLSWRTKLCFSNATQ
jgi:hypothetical protein